ncbi:MAG TPA: class I SAM-dependent methyltransferase [Candidatus Saccharimonadales bacterium]|nr:class I SAM-dependent methyltransferase [Candidatus Saccharimonadales bacterium]
MNQEKIDKLSERIINNTNSAISCLTLYIGHKLDLFNTIKITGPINSEELSKKTGYSERYLREWLECMTVNEYLEHDSISKKFSIPEEHVVVLCNRDNIAYAIPFVYWIPSLSSALDKLVEAFKTGNGVPYSAYGPDMIYAQGEGNRPMFVNDVAKWISTMPDIADKLKSTGGRILDVGCGDGWASISSAKSFPLTKIDAIDADSQSIDNAKKNVRNEGLENRISLHQSLIEKANFKEKYDLVMTFESIHDMPYPIEALQKMRDVVSADGAILIGDVSMKDKLEEKKDFLGKLYYNFSVLLCLPQSVNHANSVATGAAMTSSTLKKYAIESGFSKIDVLPIDHFLWTFYRLTL